MKIGEAEGGVDDVGKSRKTAVGEGGEEGIDAGEPEAGVDKAFSDLLPLPLFDTSTVVSSIVANDACIGHALLLGR